MLFWRLKASVHNRLEQLSPDPSFCGHFTFRATSAHDRVKWKSSKSHTKYLRCICPFKRGKNVEDSQSSDMWYRPHILTWMTLDPHVPPPRPPECSDLYLVLLKTPLKMHWKYHECSKCMYIYYYFPHQRYWIIFPSYF